MKEEQLPDMSSEWAATIPNMDSHSRIVERRQVLEILTLVRQLSIWEKQLQKVNNSFQLSESDQDTINQIFKQINQYDTTAAKMHTAHRLLILRALLGEIELFLAKTGKPERTHFDHAFIPVETPEDITKIFANRLTQLMDLFEAKRLKTEETGVLELEIENMAELITEFLIIGELPKSLALAGAVLIKKHLAVNEYFMNLSNHKKWALLLDLRQEMQEFLERV